MVGPGKVLDTDRYFVLCANVIQNPGDAKNGRCIYFNYNSARAGNPDWTDLLFLDSVGMDNGNCSVQIKDDNGGAITDSYNNMCTNYPVNFKNCITGDPNFVGTTVSASEVPATAYSSAVANFTPQNSAYLNTAVRLATVQNAEVSSTTIELDDAGHLRDDQGFNYVTTDTITLCGTTTTVTAVAGNTITTADPINCSGGEGVFWGTDDTPNIGAVAQ